MSTRSVLSIITNTRTFAHCFSSQTLAYRRILASVSDLKATQLLLTCTRIAVKIDDKTHPFSLDEVVNLGRWPCTVRFDQRCQYGLLAWRYYEVLVSFLIPFKRVDEVNRELHYQATLISEIHFPSGDTADSHHCLSERLNP